MIKKNQEKNHEKIRKIKKVKIKNQKKSKNQRKKSKNSKNHGKKSKKSEKSRKKIKNQKNLVRFFSSASPLDSYYVIGLDGLESQINSDNSSLCLLYTSPSPRDKRQSRMPSSA